jgi:hypothetical protein
VLEGGYSIQSALPYVNLAIILAMAGLDYAHVREPDFNPDALRQSPRHGEVIRRTVDYLRSVWEHPGPALAQAYPDLGESFTREKRIFYDTDNIVEQQQETVRLCEECPGWLRIDSRARGGDFGARRIWAITIPWGACARCAGEARDQYRAVMRNPRAPYDWVYLQDRVADEYRRYDVAAGQETAVRDA